MINLKNTSFSVLFILFGTLSHAEAAGDFFTGMLKKSSSGIVFVRCDNTSLEMKIDEMPGANKKHISEAYKVAEEHDYNNVYFTLIAEVISKNMEDFHINIKDVVETKEGTCNLLDALNLSNP